MPRKLPARPHLDHLRRQAKELLAALEGGDPRAVQAFRDHLPSAAGLSDDGVRAAGFRLADAQSAVARLTGFASWPKLARHVEQLRALEGTWEFERLEVEGSAMPAAALAASRILIDGDRFRTESPEAIYEGTFNIDVDAEPHAIDIVFVEGPEAGNTNHGIFRFDGGDLEICLDMNGAPRPKGFLTEPGSGHAWERLRRTARTRPANVTGGTPSAAPQPTFDAKLDTQGFEYVESLTLSRLEGEWTAVALVRDGQALPPQMLRTGSRTGVRNEHKVAFAGQVVVHALVRVDETRDPIQVDYQSLGCGTPGVLQCGIFRWQSDDACFCMAAPGQARPEDFECPPGSGRTYSQWRRKG